MPASFFPDIVLCSPMLHPCTLRTLLAGFYTMVAFSRLDVKLQDESTRYLYAVVNDAAKVLGRKVSQLRVLLREKQLSQAELDKRLASAQALGKGAMGKIFLLASGEVAKVRSPPNFGLQFACQQQ
jgi:hypothetical protein